MRNTSEIREHIQFVADMKKAGIPTRNHASASYTGPAAFVPDEAGILTISRTTRVKITSEELTRGRGFAVHPVVSDASRK
jgi:hypothetical protein